MSSTATSCAIRELRRLFAQSGNPQTLVKDDGKQFTSTEFNDFCSQSGIRHNKSPSFHPQSNGQAERFVDTFKRSFKKMKENLPATEALQKCVLNYRGTPCLSAPGAKSPAELFLGRQTRTKLSLLKPSVITNYSNRNRKMEEQYNRHHGARQKKFNIGDSVWVRTIVSRHQNKRLVNWYNSAETSSTTFRSMDKSGRDMPTSYVYALAIIQILQRDQQNSSSCPVADVEVIPRNGRSNLDDANQYGRSTAPTINRQLHNDNYSRVAGHRRRTPNQITTPLRAIDGWS
uniref:Integrase catalytic domain-containing protein n=1 Tax=Haemonchus contortus TaxID=6289 RepID=A0A7I4YE75_HAECO